MEAKENSLVVEETCAIERGPCWHEQRNGKLDEVVLIHLRVGFLFCAANFYFSWNNNFFCKSFLRTKGLINTKWICLHRLMTMPTQNEYAYTEYAYTEYAYTEYADTD